MKTSLHTSIHRSDPPAFARPTYPTPMRPQGPGWRYEKTR